MIKVGIVGMGVIGTHLAKAIDNGIPGVTLAGVSVRTVTKAGGYPVFPLDELIQRSDLIVEAATQAALKEFGPAVLAAGKHRRAELEKRRLRSRLHDQIGAGDQLVQRIRGEAARARRAPHGDARQPDARDAVVDRLRDVAADHSHAHDTDLDHRAPSPAENVA